MHCNHVVKLNAFMDNAWYSLYNYMQEETFARVWRYMTWNNSDEWNSFYICVRVLYKLMYRIIRYSYNFSSKIYNIFIVNFWNIAKWVAIILVTQISSLQSLCLSIFHARSLSSTNVWINEAYYRAIFLVICVVV